MTARPGPHPKTRWIAWWLLKGRGLCRSRCPRCHELSVAGSYDPCPVNGRQLWARCSTCSYRELMLCQPHGYLRPFSPPVPWEEIEQEINDMKAQEQNGGSDGA